MGHHRVPLNTRRSICMITLKGQVSIWPQVTVMWWPDYAMLHITRCVVTRHTQWDHAHVSSSCQSWVIVKKKKLVVTSGAPDELHEGHRPKFAPGSSTIDLNVAPFRANLSYLMRTGGNLFFFYCLILRCCITPEIKWRQKTTHFFAISVSTLPLS